jgi:hypothetical protein
MTPCARGCCFTGMQVCGKQRTCSCHVDERRPPPRGSDATRHKDPTAEQAIRNIMNTQRRKK